MYHDRYSRRRAADSFHEEEEEHALRSAGDLQCSWLLFIGALLLQMTCRSMWTSLGVISAFLLGDEGPSWLLLATPTAFIVSWGLTEPWVHRLSQQLRTVDHFMYLALAGTTLSWLGTLLSVKCPLEPSYIVPLIGVVGGCGCSLASSTCTALMKKHLPTRPGSTRMFDHISTSMSFFVMPFISFFVMDSFGDHGGLLIHSGILMQGLVGGALLRGGHWEIEPEARPRSFAFIHDEEDPFSTPSPSPGCEKMNRWSMDKSPEPLPIREDLNRAPRIAFGLGELPDTPPERRRKKKSFYRALPSIEEDAEEDLPSRESFSAPVNLISKPPRTFQHVFPPDRVLVDAEGTRWTLTPEPRTSSPSDSNLWALLPEHVSSKTHHVTTTVTQDSETGEAQIQISEAVEVSPPEEKAYDFSMPFKWMTSHPMAVPAAFLIFVTQGSLLTFASLTPVLITEYIDDGSLIDGAYCVCVMGFAWMCFVLASPCFASIDSTNHQTISIIALATSSFTLYMVSQSNEIDQLVLYSSLFGLSYGITKMTNRSVLKMSLGSEQLDNLRIAISIFTAIFHLLSLLVASIWNWGTHLKNLYFVPSSTLLFCAIVWTVQGCVSSIRAKRGHHDFTWSRRRRVS